MGGDTEAVLKAGDDLEESRSSRSGFTSSCSVENGETSRPRMCWSIRWAWWCSDSRCRRHFIKSNSIIKAIGFFVVFKDVVLPRCLQGEALAVTDGRPR